jgi:hypothetical protein
MKLFLVQRLNTYQDISKVKMVHKQLFINNEVGASYILNTPEIALILKHSP